MERDPRESLRRLRAFALAFATLLAAAGATARAAEDPELAGPPLVSPAGCSADQEWSDAYVAKVYGIAEKLARKTRTRWGLRNVDLCMLPREQVERFIDYARKGKFGMDEPEKALKWRKLSLAGRTGDIRPEDLLDALHDRDIAIRNGKARGKAAKAAGVTSSAWTNIGPANIGVSGRMRAIAPHPTIAGRILVGSVSGGIWRTTNEGQSWTPVNDFLPSVAVTCIVHDPVNPSIVYACTGEGNFNGDAIRGLGVFKSTDAGDTWTQLSATLPSDSNTIWYYVNRLAVHPQNPQILLAGTNQGLQRSTDGGITWSPVYAAGAPVNDVKFTPDGTRALVGERTGGFGGWSTDNGATWTRRSIAPSGRIELAHSALANVWYALADYASPPGRNGTLYRSVDGGQTWTLVSTPRILGGQGWYDMSLWVAPDDDSRLIVGGDSSGIMMSIDGGVNFSYIGQGVHADHHILVSSPRYTAGTPDVYCGNDGGIYKFINVKGVSASNPPNGFTPNWVSMNTNLSLTQFYGAGGSSVPERRIIGGTQDNGTWAYNFSRGTWMQTAGGDGAHSAADPTDSNYLYGQFQNGVPHRVTDGGDTAFTAQSICGGLGDGGCASGGGSTNFISPMIIDPNNPNRLYLGAQRLWRTDNAKAPSAFAVTWTAVKPVSASFANISAIAVAPGNSDIVWVGDNGGGLYRTVNGTAASPTWTANLAPQSAGGWPVMRIVIDPQDPNRVYATYGGFRSGNVLATTNGLAAAPLWQDKSAGLPRAPVRGFAVHPTSNLWWYAGTEVGVFATEDGGNTWNTTNDGPGTVSVEELFFLDPATLVAVTHGRGIFTADVQAPPPGAATFAFDRDIQYTLEGTSATLRVLRSGTSTGTAQVTVNTTGGTATPGSDYDALSNVTLTWASGDTTARTVTINTRADSQAEGQESVVASLSAPVNGTLGAQSSTMLVIFDPEAFPPDCAMPAGWVKPTGVQAGWSVDFTTAFQGTCSLKSDPTGFGSSRISFTGTFAAGNITFRRRTAMANGNAFFKFFIDGVVQAPDCGFGNTFCSGANVTGPTASGNTDWTQPSQLLSFPITAGTHTIMFGHERPGGDFPNGAAWVDALTLPLGAPVVRKVPVDLDADGRSDIVWTHADGRVALWLMNGLANTSGAGILGPGTGWSVAFLADFDNDGKTDVMWRHADGRVAIYLLDGVGVKATAQILNGGSPWTPTQVADFDADGKADIVWTNADGSVAIWLMDGTAMKGGSGIFPAGTQWRVNRTGDFDGDGKADLLWTHADGRAAVWLMDGLASKATAQIFQAGTGWSPTHVADFNGDGKSDIAWRHTNGSVAVWLMNGTAPAGDADILGSGTGWAIAFTGDFDGDNKADLLWAHSDGRAAIWLMDGLTVKATNQILNAGGWSPRRLADLDGDGRSDIVWQHTDGTTAAWLMNGTAMSGGNNLTGAGTGWSVSSR